MEVMTHISRSIPISPGDQSQLGSARRQALSLAASMAFDAVRQGQLGIIVTEAAGNIAKHAGTGEILLTAWNDGSLGGIDMLALDSGPGIRDLPAALRDGYSTAGTPGNGLGAISRLSGTFQAYSSEGRGTVLFARVLRTSREVESETRAYRMSAVTVPVAGETMCGDGWSSERTAGRSIYIMADGLGHGPMAAEAAQEAVRVFHLTSRYSPERILQEVHGALAKTRGAAVSVAEIVHDQQMLNYAGAGNISAAICTAGKTKGLVTMNGTVGHSIGRLQQFSYSWPADSALIMHSDGLSARWNVEQYPGLTARHPALLAGVLFRDFSRKRDDATILVSCI
jgi:anti-sigma regulatory factor (Ser/Thr protein kinase)